MKEAHYPLYVAHPSGTQMREDLKKNLLGWYEKGYIRICGKMY